MSGPTRTPHRGITAGCPGGGGGYGRFPGTRSQPRFPALLVRAGGGRGIAIGDAEEHERCLQFLRDSSTTCTPGSHGTISGNGKFGRDRTGRSPVGLGRKSPCGKCPGFSGFSQPGARQGRRSGAGMVVGVNGRTKGKGQATDQLGDHVDYCCPLLRGQCRSHDRGRGERLPAAFGHPEPELHSGKFIGNGWLSSTSSARSPDCAAAASASHMIISANAHIIATYHQVIDKVTERFLGKAKIGTTRNAGPGVLGQGGTGLVAHPAPFRRVHPAPEGRGLARAEEPPVVKVYNRLGTRPGADHRARRSTPTMLMSA